MTMMFCLGVKAQTVAFDPIGLNIYRGSFDSILEGKLIHAAVTSPMAGITYVSSHLLY